MACCPAEEVFTERLNANADSQFQQALQFGCARSDGNPRSLSDRIAFNEKILNSIR
jgi:hypothetical protein